MELMGRENSWFLCTPRLIYIELLVPRLLTSSDEHEALVGVVARKMAWSRAAQHTTHGYS